jgi:hypothetical protein
VTAEALGLVAERLRPYLPAAATWSVGPAERR